MYQQPMGFPQPPMGFPRQSSSSNILSGIIILAIICVIVWATVFRKDGKFSEWGNWGNCSKPCGGGTQTRTRKYIPPEFGGKDVDKKDDLTETKDCNTEACKIDAKMSQWENSGTCYNQITTSNPKPCGGLQKQIRSYTPPENGGKDLPITEKNLLEQIVDCETKCADIDGRFTDWVDDKSNNCYSSQSDTSQIITCGNGYKKQVRTYIPATGKGKNLTNKDELSKYINCQLKDCPPKVDGYCDNWLNPNAECSCINDTYKITQTRKYNPPTGGGKEHDCKNNLSRDVVCKDNSDIKDPNPPQSTPGGVCPSEAILNNSIDYNEKNCSPSTGTNRKFIANSEYIFPVGANKDHHKYIKDNFSSKIAELKKLKANEIKEYIDSSNNKVKFTRKNSTIPEKYNIEIQYNCPDIDNRDENSVKDLWVLETNCKKDNLNNTIYGRISSTLDELKKIDTNENVRNKFKMYNINSLTKNNDRELIKQCYGNDKYLKITNHFMDKNNNWYNKLYPGTEINIENSPEQYIVIIVSGDFALKIQKDGNLILYNHRNDTGAIWASGTFNKGVTKLRMQWDGNLVLYDKADNAIWSTGTFNDSDSYLEITNSGYLILRKSNNEQLKILYPNEKDFVINYLKTTYWDRSAWTLFSDKKGRVWRATWSELDANFNENDKKFSEDCGYCRFRGFSRSENDGQWNVNQIDLKHENGTKTEIPDSDKPSQKDDSSNNYNNGDDRSNFKGDQNTERKPPQLSGGIEKPNFIPGYYRISYSNGTGSGDTGKFLLSDRGGSRWRQAFVLYKIHTDKNVFANEIYNKNPELVKRIINEKYYKL